MLFFATQYPNPTSSQLFTFGVVLALAAAGVGAILPGSLGVEWTGVGGLPAVRAGGALAMFAMVFAFQPKIEQAIVRITPPKESPFPVAEEFLEANDGGDMSRVWTLLDADAKGLVVGSEVELRELYQNSVSPLGRVIHRAKKGASLVETPPGFPIGAYRQINFKTQFETDGQRCRLEVITVRANQDMQWRVFSYVISPETVEC
jgi:hypothetical protein